MHHLLATPRGRTARNQQELVEASLNRTPFKDEDLRTPLCDLGFVMQGQDGYERMDRTVFVQAVTSLFKFRPTAHKWDIVPDTEYEEQSWIIRSPELFRMTKVEQAEVIAEQFVTRPRMVGFRWELHDVGGRSDSSGPPPSISIFLYEAKEDPIATVPLNIKVRWRTNF